MQLSGALFVSVSFKEWAVHVESCYSYFRCGGVLSCDTMFM